MHPGFRRQPHPPRVRRRPRRRVRRPHGRRAVRGRRHQRHDRRPPARRPTTSCADVRRARLAEARRAGITTIEIKSGYGATVDGRGPPAATGAGELTEETTFLGAHVVPPEYAGRADEYVDLVCGEMLAACGPHARWIDAFCEVGAFDADQCRAVLDAGRAAGLGSAAARQPARVRDRACSSPSSSDARRPTTARTSPTTTSPPSPAATRSPRSCRRPTSRPASPTPTPAASSTPVPPSRWPPTATPGRATPRRCRSSSPWPCASCG